MVVQQVSESGNVTDAYTRLQDVVGLNSVARLEVVEGFVTFNSFGATVFYGGTKPAATAPGTQWAAGSGFGLGPRRDKGSGWRLDYLWVKNTTAGSTAVAVVQGNVEGV